jgi:hypothetical protein
MWVLRTVGLLDFPELFLFSLFFSLSSRSQAALFAKLCFGLLQWLRRCSVVHADNILRQDPFCHAVRLSTSLDIRFCRFFDSGYLIFFWFVYAADVFCDDEIDLVNVNACKELTKVQKPQSQWSKPSKNHDKIPNNYVNLPRKNHTYRIQQPRTVI